MIGGSVRIVDKAARVEQVLGIELLFDLAASSGVAGLDAAPHGLPRQPVQRCSTARPRCRRQLRRRAAIGRSALGETSPASNCSNRAITMPLPAWAWIEACGSMLQHQATNCGHAARQHAGLEHQRRVAAAAGNSASVAPQCRGLRRRTTCAVGDAQRCAIRRPVAPSIQSTSRRVPSRPTTSRPSAAGRQQAQARVLRATPGRPAVRRPTGVVRESTSAASRRSAVARSRSVAGQQRRALGHRPDLERDLRDDAQRAQRAGQQFAEIVAGDVLHHAPPPLNGTPRPSTAVMPIT